MTNQEVLDSKTNEEVCKDICDVFNVDYNEIMTIPRVAPSSSYKIKMICIHILRVKKGLSINKTATMFCMSRRNAMYARSKSERMVGIDIEYMRLYNIIKVSLKYLDLWEKEH